MVSVFIFQGKRFKSSGCPLTRTFFKRYFKGVDFAYATPFFLRLVNGLTVVEGKLEFYLLKLHF